MTENSINTMLKESSTIIHDNELLVVQHYNFITLERNHQPLNESHEMAIESMHSRSLRIYMFEINIESTFI